MTVRPLPGGATTQDGIYFQNCITALRLAHMLTQDEFENSDGTPLGRIIHVQAEARSEVDDTVVKYSSGRTEYIQAKMDIKFTGKAWVTLWGHFYDQYHSSTFKQDRNGDVITLAVRWSKGMSVLENLFARAYTSDTSKEWQQQLTKEQQRLKEKIKTTLSSIGRELDEESMLRFSRSLTVWQSHFEGDPRGTDTFEIVINRTLQSIVAGNVFAQLIALVGNEARRTGAWDYEKLKTQLKVKSSEVPGETRIGSSPRGARSAKGSRTQQNSIKLINKAKISRTRIRDIVGEVVEGAGESLDSSPRRNIRILNEAVLNDVVVRDIVGSKRRKND